MEDKFSRETFNRWENDPVTQEFRRKLQWEVAVRKQGWELGVWRNEDPIKSGVYAEILHAEMRTIEDILNFSYDNLVEDLEGENAKDFTGGEQGSS